MGLPLELRSAALVADGAGHQQWRELHETRVLEPRRAALLLCDVWNDHTSRGAVERLEAMIPAMASVVEAMRAEGVTIVHCPSDCMDFYAESMARMRVLAAPQIAPPPDLEHEDPPLPIDTEGPFSDTDEPEWRGTDYAVEHNWYNGRDRPWWRQHPGIRIDEEKDGISDQGGEVYSFLQASNVNTVLMMGVHTNMCILHRSFGIKQLTRWGVECILLRDLTDAMYSPARPPYVSHDEGTELVVSFIEKFWCRSALGSQILSVKRNETDRWAHLHQEKSRL